MQEYVTRAVVLDKQLHGGDANARYSFFTERYGKIAARAVSSRKITSKLAGHLEPGTLTSVRIIETHGAQVVDALKIARARISLRDLGRLNSLLGEWEPDPELWQELARVAPRIGAFAADPLPMAVPAVATPIKFSWANTLAILGWDPRGAICARCNMTDRPAPHFFIPRQEFFCTPCASNFNRNELLLVNEQF